MLQWNRRLVALVVFAVSLASVFGWGGLDGLCRHIGW
jgi:hypothetical protein